MEHQRSAILEAAVACFAARGSRAVSVADICRGAGVSRDTFYRCYDNKDDVVDALYEQAVNAPMLAVAAAPGADYADPQWLRAAVDSVVDTILAHHQVARFLFLESAERDSRAHAVIDRALRRVAAGMQRWCRGRHGAAPSQRCFMGLLQAAQWQVQDAIDGGLSPARVRACKRAILELYLAAFNGMPAALRS